MKAHFQQFIMKYTRSPGSTEMSTSDATNHYEAFMSLTSAIIKKKIEMFDLHSLEETPNIIISLLLIRFAMIRDFLSKIQKEKGFTGIDYNKMVGYSQASITLYRSYLDEIKRQIEHFEERTIIAESSNRKLTQILTGNQDEDKDTMARIRRNDENMVNFAQHLSTLKRMREELSVIVQLTREIEDLHGRATVITQAATPPRPPRPPLQPPPQQGEENQGGGCMA